MRYNLPLALTLRLMTYLEKFSVLLLDMNGTFMFGHDRFGPDEDYFATYSALGGERLDRDTLVSTIDRTLVALLTTYNDPRKFDDFPSLEEAFRVYGYAEEEDLPFLERVFAVHEIGYIPATHASLLQQLAATHKLGVVSNVCSRTALWLSNFRQSAVFELFQSLTFSADYRSIKPSAALFRRALDHFPVDAKVLVIGDNIERDIIPAKALGMSTVWIAPAGATHEAADRVVASLTDIASIAE